jgi:hypothetical protein
MNLPAALTVRPLRRTAGSAAERYSAASLREFGAALLEAAGAASHGLFLK